jgi:hypothetical protein
LGHWNDIVRLFPRPYERDTRYHVLVVSN